MARPPFLQTQEQFISGKNQRRVVLRLFREHVSSPTELDAHDIAAVETLASLLRNRGGDADRRSIKPRNSPKQRGQNLRMGGSGGSLIHGGVSEIL